MNVIVLLHDAVFMNAGSYVMRPKSVGCSLIWRRSIARIVPSLIGRSYDLPVRLSVIVTDSFIFAAPSCALASGADVIVAIEFLLVAPFWAAGCEKDGERRRAREMMRMR